jgi:hypothetical protein
MSDITERLTETRVRIARLASGMSSRRIPPNPNDDDVAADSDVANAITEVSELRRQLAEAKDTAAVTYGQLLAARDIIKEQDARIARLQAVARITKAIVDAKGSKGRPRGSVGARKYAELTAAWRSLEPALDQCNAHNDLEPQGPAAPEKGG